MRQYLLLLCLVTSLLFSACGTILETTNQAIDKKIQGVWNIESMDVGIGENQRTRVPPAFMIFIMEKHYSAIRDFSDPPRKDMSSGTAGFMADAGTYEYDGSEFVVHHKVAMIPNMMHEGSSMSFTCQIEGDNTLILCPQYDKMVIPGMNIKPSPDGKMGYGDMAVRYVFKRLE
jgi:hypothetical protein